MDGKKTTVNLTAENLQKYISLLRKLEDHKRI